MAVSTETPRDFCAVATDLALLAPETLRELAVEAAAKGVGLAQLVVQRGLLSVTQVDIVETLLHPRDVVPGYEILDLLGQGGMGVVYRARQTNLDRVVALKTVLMSQMTDPSAAARFEQEAVTLAKLRHPHVVAAHDFGRHAGRLFFAMELVEGEDVEKLIERRGRLDEATAWGLARQAASGLAEAARLGVVHRDIKPANLLLVEPPFGFPLPKGMPLVKIADFGLAILTMEAELRTRLTTAGSAVGSPHYMAPEQLEGGAIDARADIYALGASVFHMLAGQPPFYGKSLSQIVGAKLGQGPPSLVEHAPGISPAAARLVADLMAREPQDRPADYVQLIEQIDALSGFQLAETATVAIDNVAALSRNVSSTRHDKSRWRLYGLALAAVLLVVGFSVGGAYLYSLEPRLPGRPRLSPTGWGESLFDGQSLRGFLTTHGSWQPTRNEEDAKILAGTGGLLRRPLVHADLPNRPPLELYRLKLLVNLKDATAAEVQFAIPAEGAAAGSCSALRITSAGSQLVARTATDGEPRPLGSIRPLRATASGCHEVKIERMGTHYWVALDDRLLGVAPIGQQPERGEFRLYVEGGPAWFSDLEVEELEPEEGAVEP